METLVQTPVQSILFFVLYGVTGVVPLLAALYLLLCPVNAIAPGVTPPVRLRRWTAAFFGVTTLAHVWWLLFYVFSGDVLSVSYLVIVTLDTLLFFTTFAGTLFAMLQDRRRPLWPWLAALIPFVVIGGLFMVNPGELVERVASIYLILLGLAFTGYMIFAIRQYGRWLNVNYADLENKRVWLCQAVSLVCMLTFVLYVLATDMVLLWFIHIIELVLIGLLLWRVETLPTLELPAQPQAQQPTTAPVNIDIDHIEKLLKEYCVAQQIYLQHDLMLEELAQAIGTNRSYLSQYFSRQGITYNTYINSLRINHFISLYQKIVATTEQKIDVKQLVHESGFSSYRTFSRAFTQRTGQTVTAWQQGNGE
jgi:AraC-like DNA-binding protein